MVLLLFYVQIHIWEERKVFGSRGQILKEEFLGRKIESTNGNGKDSGLKLVKFNHLCLLHLCPFECDTNLIALSDQRHNAGSALDNIVTGYQIVYGGPMDDEAVLSKCLNIMDFFDKVEKEISDDNNSGIIVLMLLLFLSWTYAFVIVNFHSRVFEGLH